MKFEKHELSNLVKLADAVKVKDMTPEVKMMLRQLAGCVNEMAAALEIIKEQRKRYDNREKAFNILRNEIMKINDEEVRNLLKQFVQQKNDLGRERFSR